MTNRKIKHVIFGDLTLIASLSVCLVLMGCSAKVVGQHCAFPTESDPLGNRERAAALIIREPRVLLWNLDPKFSVTIQSEDYSVEYEQELPSEYALGTNISCVWLSKTQVSISAEYRDESPRHLDPPFSTIFEFQNGQWVERSVIQ